MNEVWFSREDCKKELHLTFIKNILELGVKMSNGYFEVLISGDGEGATCVQFEKRYYNDDEETGYFTYVDELNDEVVMKYVRFPDGHYDYIDRRMSKTLAIEDWAKEHPSWYKNEYGNWCNREEESRFPQIEPYGGTEANKD